MTPAWYGRPEGQALELRKTPRLASWNRSSDPDQIRLREYLDDTADLLASSVIDRAWALWLDVGLTARHDLLDTSDLDNYAFPLAARVRNEHLVSVWCTKRHATTSHVVAGPARRVDPPPAPYTMRTTASGETTAYKQQIHAAVADAAEIAEGPVRLQIAFVVGPRRNWLNLWKPTIDALDPLLGRTRGDRDWHPRDGRVTELGLHLATDATLGNHVELAIAAQPAAR